MGTEGSISFDLLAGQLHLAIKSVAVGAEQREIDVRILLLFEKGMHHGELFYRGFLRFRRTHISSEMLLICPQIPYVLGVGDEFTD